VRNKVLRFSGKTDTHLGFLTATAHFGTKGEIDWIDGILEDITERNMSKKNSTTRRGALQTSSSSSRTP